MYTLLTLLFIIVIAGGLIWAYIHYLGEKAKALQLVERGICPSCHKESLHLIDQKSGGCSGVNFMEFKCESCGFTTSYNLTGGGCGSGGCKL